MGNLVGFINTNKSPQRKSISYPNTLCSRWHDTWHEILTIS